MSGENASNPSNQRLILLNPNHKKNADLLPSQILGEKAKTASTLLPNRQVAGNEDSDPSGGSSNDESGGDEDNEEEEEDDGEVWLFGKPKSGPRAQNKFLDKPDTRSAQNQKYVPKQQQQQQPLPPLPPQQQQKPRKKLQSQQKRSSGTTAKNGANKEKDFSDQDEVDRDVTTVLDIEKLKRLPKLL